MFDPVAWVGGERSRGQGLPLAPSWTFQAASLMPGSLLCTLAMGIEGAVESRCRPGLRQRGSAASLRPDSQFCPDSREEGSQDPHRPVWVPQTQIRRWQLQRLGLLGGSKGLGAGTTCP